MADENDTAIIPVDDPADPAEAVHALEHTLARFMETADVNRVFGSPLRRGEVTIIPTAEVLAGVGFGVGYGGADSNSKDPDGGRDQGGGGGGGGGGRILSRPVAVVVIEPEGVRVEPVIDQTKIGLAALTAAGFIFTTLLRMMGGRKDGD